MRIPWNLVTKHLHGHELLGRKIRQKIATLEKHLKHFPADAVHLHLALERNPKKEIYTAALTLRLPSTLLRSEKKGPDLIKAFDEAVKVLLRELEALKAKLRREALWKRKDRRRELHLRKAVGFAPEPEPEGKGPQNLGDVMRSLLKENYSRLLRYVRRHLWHATTAGDVPRDAIDPRGVVNEVARKVLARPEKKPASMEDLLWFYVLARQELVRRIRNLKRQGRETVSLEEVQVLPEDWAVVEGYDAEQPLDIIERQADPPLALTHELLPEDRERRPDEVASRRDLLSGLRRVVSGWPKEEREVFELYFVEGFEPEEIAMVVGLGSEQVEKRIATVQQRLRAAALEQALI